MNYKEQYKHPKWQKRRLEILDRDGFACQKCCDVQKTLHVHHIQYIKNGSVWDSPGEDLITLCEDCHSFISRYNLSHEEFNEIVLLKFTRADGSVNYFAAINGGLVITSAGEANGADLASIKSIIDIAILQNHG